MNQLTVHGVHGVSGQQVLASDTEHELYKTYLHVVVNTVANHFCKLKNYVRKNVKACGQAGLN